MSRYVKPPKLKTGDTIGIVAPSDAVERQYVQNGLKVLKSWGLKTKLGKHLFSQVGDFAAGTAEERREDIIKFIKDREIKGIWAAAGGYAATEVLPLFKKEIVEELKNNPKWFLGYSDVCCVLNALMSFKIVSVHGPNLGGLTFWDEKSLKWLKSLLFGEDSVMELGSDFYWKPLIYGEAEGRLLVSNLDSFVATLGTKFDPLMHGNDPILLGLEDWWVEKSTLQRQVDTILNHKKFSRIKAVILGRFEGIGEQTYPEWGKRVTVESLIESRVRVSRPGLPLAVFPNFGHVEEPGFLRRIFPVKKSIFVSLPNGINAKLTVESSSANLLLLEPSTSDGKSD
ncbi:hypothetical protein A3F07_04465 [candidate division WWE3 bacterium RIFCSPHIGHO2_12_FULL_38_15]|uniref:LD-carboxypeptidase n=1 Tax=candidate division WWE3 bacterium RIFCSPHIGHO2_02_FULL_38_14 TaxID=1802620 RepID=A0A1F4VBR9_UNCKA|nr:MAG: hypothetical protein A2793_01255 [candidate division WWE3 bacterium RIFCSPHIGHO2_01_FULL_38_45]OGC49004.1 MAG: hypothetical protein A3F07_04465 [candidate division WWE3 bacterium RIFCSPHIGHO2_12_FULL_38_15]OGC54615.1 MAG: hypothetical protein A3B64_03080 [candidate division WWE3 bacterium RIFCSPLOWO2_01_FULL_37_24]OGC54676.1 MAG: hypothetical protein A3D91_03645 [candidate division WWE3 bacterium RIFCSPHIGHO2_02_FULL_38_14]HLB51356.1 LD-carboxypeptidase [Patescibacteria group bacterium]